MNKKILAGLLATGIIATWATSAFADIGNIKWGFKASLTAEEQTALESMTGEEKKEFFTLKREEKKAERQAESDVIDALLAGDSLTPEQEIIRSEIITKRAQKAEMREKIKAIRDKVDAGEELSEEEQAVLDEMKSKWRKWGKHRMNRNR